MPWSFHWQISKYFPIVVGQVFSKNVCWSSTSSGVGDKGIGGPREGKPFFRYPTQEADSQLRAPHPEGRDCGVDLWWWRGLRWAEDDSLEPGLPRQGSVPWGMCLGLTQREQPCAPKETELLDPPTEGTIRGWAMTRVSSSFTFLHDSQMRGVFKREEGRSQMAD